LHIAVVGRAAAACILNKVVRSIANVTRARLANARPRKGQQMGGTKSSRSSFIASPTRRILAVACAALYAALYLVMSHPLVLP